MSSNKKNDNSNVFIRILTIILVVLLLLGVIAIIARLLTRPQGMYIEYDGTIYGTTALGSSTGGISVPYDSTVTFTIGNTDGWGVYSVQDCTVKIVPNVDTTHDFEFTVGDSYKSSLYSAESDITAAFCEDYDGKSISVSDNGTFTITTDKLDMSDVLNAIYSEGVTVDGEYLIAEYPYIALSVTSPDGSQSLTVPLLFKVDVEGINLDKDGIVF